MSIVRQQLDTLFSEWCKKDLHLGYHPFIKDGIVNENLWLRNPFDKRFLFVLKEAYGTDGENDWYLNDWLNNDDENGPKGHKRDTTWNVINKWVKGLLRTTKSSIFPYDNLFNDYNILKNISVLNIKKSNGYSQSSDGDILKYALNDKNEVIKEIELINPGVIISCSKMFYIDDICNGKVVNGNLNDSYYYYSNCIGNRKRLFIHYGHPGAHIKKAYYYYGLMGIYQQALINETLINNEHKK